MAKLTIINPDGTETRYGLGGKLFTVGRAPDNDISLPDGTSSNYHAVLKGIEGDEFSVTDLGSTNHTRVNGRQITTADLHNEDRLLFGDTLAIFTCDASLTKKSEERADTLPAKKKSSNGEDSSASPTEKTGSHAIEDETDTAKNSSGGCLGLFLICGGLTALLIPLFKNVLQLFNS